VLGGLSVASFGVYAGFGVAAKSAVDDMRAGCAPTCASSRVDDARRDLVVANVAFGVGAAALGAGAIVLLVRRFGGGPEEPAQAAWTFGVGAGGVAVSGTF
jgi:hypothetical protein